MIEKAFTACKISNLIDPSLESSPLCAFGPKSDPAARGEKRAKR